MVMFNTKLGVAFLALFSTSGSATAAAKDSGENRLGRKRRATVQSNIRKVNHNNLERNRQENSADITEDVAFFTRELQTGSLPITTRRPTPRPNRRPTPNPTPNPTGGVSTPFPTAGSFDTPNPTKSVVITPSPSESVITPNPTQGVVTPNPTPGPTPFPVLDTPSPVAAPPADGPVANDDTGSMNADEGIGFFAVLSNDVPAPGEELVVRSIVEDPSNGQCTISLDLIEVTYIPELGFVGTDSCVYEACDAVPVCDTATLTVTVEASLMVAQWLSLPL